MAIPRVEDIQKKTRNRQPSEKQAEWLKQKALDPTATDIEVARRSGYSVLPGSKASGITKSNNQKARTLLDRNGMTLDWALKRIKEGCLATRSVPVVCKKYDEQGKKCGVETKIIEVPDYKTRKSYLQMVVDIHNAYPAKKGEMDVRFPQLPMIGSVPVNDVKALKAMEAEFEVTSG